MANRDLLRRLLVSQSLSPAARVTGTSTGSAVDLRGFDSAVVLVNFGTYTDGTHTPSVQQSVDGTTYTAAAASDIDGTFTVGTSTAVANAAQSVGYIGTQRFVRVVMTTTGATTGAVSGASIIAGHPRNVPTV